MRSGSLKALVVALALGAPVAAQDLFSPVIVVNDRAITGYELDQRIRLLEAFGTSGDLPDTARTQLVEERLKQQELDRVGAVLTEEGLAEWPGTVERLSAPVVPHMGWTEVDVPAGSTLFAGVETERFYFVHSYAVHEWTLPEPRGSFAVVAPRVTHATHGERLVAAVENGPLSATQFHPEKSGEAGLHLLENWVRSL